MFSVQDILGGCRFYKNKKKNVSWKKKIWNKSFAFFLFTFGSLTAQNFIVFYHEREKRWKTKNHRKLWMQRKCAARWRRLYRKSFWTNRTLAQRRENLLHEWKRDRDNNEWNGRRIFSLKCCFRSGGEQRSQTGENKVQWLIRKVESCYVRQQDWKVFDSPDCLCCHKVSKLFLRNVWASSFPAI